MLCAYHPLRARSLTATVVLLAGGIALSGCWEQMRTVRGKIAVNDAEGRRIPLWDVHIVAYPKAVARDAFTKAGPQLVTYYSKLRTEIDASVRAEDELRRSDEFQGRAAELYEELVSLTNLRDTLGRQSGGEEPIARRLEDLKDDANQAGFSNVLQRYQKYSIAHSRRVAALQQLKESTPRISSMLMSSLPDSTLVGSVESDGRYQIKMPTGAPFVIAVTGTHRADRESEVYCWIVPVGIGLSKLTEVDFNNSNLLTDLDHAKRTVGQMVR